MTPLLLLVVICAPASRKWATVGEGMCEPPEHTLNSYSYMTETESECGRLCERQRRCRFTVFDPQRGYCYLHTLCTATASEPYLALRLGKVNRFT